MLHNLERQRDKQRANSYCLPQSVRCTCLGVDDEKGNMRRSLDYRVLNIFHGFYSTYKGHAKLKAFAITIVFSNVKCNQITYLRAYLPDGSMIPQSSSSTSAAADLERLHRRQILRTAENLSDSSE